MTEPRSTKRDKHPARSARILSTGIALTSTLGLSAAYTLAAQAKALSNVGLSDPSVAADPTLVPAGDIAQVPAVAPTVPASATPVISQSTGKSGGKQQIATSPTGTAPTQSGVVAPQDASSTVVQVTVPTVAPAPVAAAPVAPAPAPVVTVAPKTSSSK